MPRRAGTVAARGVPARPAARRRRAGGGAAPRRLAPAGGGTPAIPARVLRTPFARAARARAGGVLDALLRGRGWIALVGVLLVGIVFFNVDLLRLNRQIAHTTQRSSALKRDNARLRLELARLGSSERIQRVATERGLVLPAPGDVRYLRASRRDARKAAGRISEPSGVQVPPAQPVQPQPQAGLPPPAGARPADPQTQTQPQQPPQQPPAGAAPVQPQAAPQQPSQQTAPPTPAG